MKKLSSLTFLLSCSVYVLSLIFYETNSLSLIYFPILTFSSMELNLSLLIDWSSLFFAASVLLISSMIIVYSLSYIPTPEHLRFSLILLSFIFSMILLIFSNNIFFIMIGWDGLGLSSYILVIYYQNFKSSESGILTILSNRIGDITILLSIGILSYLGSWDMFLSKDFSLIILLLLLTAALSKSAQTPFSAWLPAAMAAPTPISALVHSSTLVTAGVYMMIRVMFLTHPFVMLTIMISSSLTLFFAGISANWEQDMKKIIALSTLSQIAMMMFAISLNSHKTAFFHLITHAMFKSTMFLCAGIMIHGTLYQDMRSHGSSCNNSPLLLSSLGITSMALMGLPFLAGFFSKDAIMETLIMSSTNLFLLSFIMFSLGLTASYSSRMLNLSSNFILKSQKDKLFHMNFALSLPILILTPISIFSGSFLMWFTIPFQTIIIPNLMKISILLLIVTGLMNGLTLSFKSKNFTLLGETSISLWFLHMISCNFPLKSLKFSFYSWNTDKTWLEFSSAQGSLFFLSPLSKLPDMLSSLSLFILSLFSISPFLILSMYMKSFP